MSLNLSDVITVNVSFSKNSIGVSTNNSAITTAHVVAEGAMDAMDTDLTWETRNGSVYVRRADGTGAEEARTFKLHLGIPE